MLNVIVVILRVVAPNRTKWIKVKRKLWLWSQHCLAPQLCLRTNRSWTCTRSLKMGAGKTLVPTCPNLYNADLQRSILFINQNAIIKSWHNKKYRCLWISVVRRFTDVNINILPTPFKNTKGVFKTLYTHTCVCVYILLVRLPLPYSKQDNQMILPKPSTKNKGSIGDQLI